MRDGFAQCAAGACGAVTPRLKIFAACFQWVGAGGGGNGAARRVRFDWKESPARFSASLYPRGFPSQYLPAHWSDPNPNPALSSGRRPPGLRPSFPKNHRRRFQMAEPVRDSIFAALRPDFTPARPPFHTPAIWHADCSSSDREATGHGSGNHNRSVGWKFRGSLRDTESGARRVVPHDEPRPPSAPVGTGPRGCAYLREPRRGLRNWLWRAFCFFLLGLLITNVPLPKYSAL